MNSLLPSSEIMFPPLDKRWKSTSSSHKASVREGRSKNTACTSLRRWSNICTGLCYVLCISFSDTSPWSQRVPGSGMPLLQYRARIKYMVNQQAKRTLSPIRTSMSSRNCFTHAWSGMNRQLPISRHARVFVPAGLSKNCC